MKRSTAKRFSRILSQPAKRATTPVAQAEAAANPNIGAVEESVSHPSPEQYVSNFVSDNGLYTMPGSRFGKVGRGSQQVPSKADDSSNRNYEAAYIQHAFPPVVPVRPVDLGESIPKPVTRELSTVEQCRRAGRIARDSRTRLGRQKSSEIVSE